MPLTWREKHYGEEGGRRWEAFSIEGGKFRAKSWDGERIGEYGSLADAKAAVEAAYKGQGGAQTPAEPAQAPKAPEPPKPASEPPSRTGAHAPPHKGRR